MPRVFLSRVLQDSQGPFARLQERVEWQLTANSLLEFKAVPIERIPPVDWLFFYSRQGVKFFLEQAIPPVSVQLATIGPATAKQLEQKGYKVSFTGIGKPDKVAASFLAIAAGKRVGFVQARHSRKSVQLILGDQIIGLDVIAYDNIPKPLRVKENADYLIFTSPLNFETYQQSNRIIEKQRLIAIGTTTAQSFKIAGFSNYRIAKYPNEEALLACLLAWQKEQPF